MADAHAHDDAPALAPLPDGWADLPLEERHARHVHDSGISPAVAKARGYETLTTKSSVKRLGFSETQASTAPGLLIPVWAPGGALFGYQFRPDQPRIDAKGRLVKYETPRHAAPGLDVNPLARAWVMNPGLSVLITEGAKKADAAATHELGCIAVAGVSSWRTPDAVAGFDCAPWKDRDVYLAFDSDWRRNPNVRRELMRLSRALSQRGATVRYLDLPEANPGQKVGLDDYFAAGGSVIELFNRHATSDLPDEEDGDPEGPYAVFDGRICSRKTLDGGGSAWQALAEFSAEILEERSLLNGVEIRRELVIAGELSDGAPLPPAAVRTSEFDGMRWVGREWGARAIITAGMSTRDRLREAIQRLSPAPRATRIYEQPGWWNLAGSGWCFLHAGGAIGATGLVEDIEVRLRGAASRVSLPEPVEGEELRAAVTFLLGFLDVAPDHITVPAFAVPWRAAVCVIRPADVALWFAGASGTLKTELAAVVMRFAGAGFDRLVLPAQWSSTANALERLAHDFNDLPFVVDDFAPAGTERDIQRLHQTAERLIRAAGNAAGRDRMNADGRSSPKSSVNVLQARPSC